MRSINKVRMMTATMLMVAMQMIMHDAVDDGARADDSDNANQYAYG